jgi:hypothetical protein
MRHVVTVHVDSDFDSPPVSATQSKQPALFWGVRARQCLHAKKSSLESAGSDVELPGRSRAGWPDVRHSSNNVTHRGPAPKASWLVQNAMMTWLAADD